MPREALMGARVEAIAGLSREAMLAKLGPADPRNRTNLRIAAVDRRSGAAGGELAAEIPAPLTFVDHAGARDSVMARVTSPLDPAAR